MNYFDTSALIKRFVDEAGSDAHTGEDSSRLRDSRRRRASYARGRTFSRTQATI